MHFLIGTNQLILNAGDAVFINAGLLHGAWENLSTDCRYHSLVFHPQLIGGAHNSVFWEKYIDPLRLNKSLPYLIFRTDYEWQKEVIKRIENGWENMRKQEPGFEFQVLGALSYAICEICLHSCEYGRKASASQQREEERIKEMLSFVRTHFAEDISVADIAASAFVSSTECMRCFRNILHTTPNRYLRQQRLRRAEKLLRTSSRRVEEIAEQCGFRDMGYFSRCFRTEFGATPLKYRKLHRTSAPSHDS